MKKSFLTLACAMAFVISTASAATKKSKAPSYTGVIKANPLGLAVGYFNAEYEMPLGVVNGLALNGTYYSYGNSVISLTGIGAGGMYRFYSKGKGKQLNSFYYGPLLNVASFTWKYDYYDYDTNFNLVTAQAKSSLFAIAPGFGLGRQWIFNGGFTIDLGGGVQYYIVSAVQFKDANGNALTGVTTLGGFHGIWPTLWFSLGYAFGK